MAIAAIAVPAAASIGGAVISSGAQKSAANEATDTQLGMFDKTQQNLAPFISTGGAAYKDLSNLEGIGTANPLTSPLLRAPTMTESQLESTPGYQFNLTQGLKSVQNSAAARGLGSSGAALKGADAYATGLADSTYQNQYSNAVTNQTNQYNRLQGVGSIGENAAAGLGNNAQATGANIGSNIIGAANATGAAVTGAATSIGNAALSGYGINSLQNMYGNQSYDPTAAANGLPWSDIRLKKDIEYLGEENDFSVYEFSYLWSPVRYIGVMAQDIIERAPSAVRKCGVYLTVDYSQLGVKFREAK